MVQNLNLSDLSGGNLNFQLPSFKSRPGSNATMKSGGGKTGDDLPKGYKSAQLQQFTPDQIKLFKQMLQHLGPDSYLSRLAGGDEELFDEMEAPEMEKFSGLLGGIASRFSQGSGLGGGQGSLGQRRSSAFQNQTTSAAQNFSQQLRANRQDLQKNALNDLMGYSQNLLGQKPYERALVPKEPKFIDKWLGFAGNVMGNAGKAASGFTG